MPTSSSDTDYILSGVNITDIDDIWSYKQNGVLYGTPGTFLHNAGLVKEFGEKILDASAKSMGNGAYNNSIQNFISKLDRHGTAYVPINTLNYGYTFITRPRLNMTTGNLKQHPVLSLLATKYPKSVAFAIRMLLDTCISRGDIPFSYADSNATLTPDQKAIFEAASKNVLVDIRNPFFTPLCNGLRGISGYPDFNMETVTMGEDFHSGDMTFVKGAELFNRTQELSLEFVDIQGSVILSCFFYWCLYMALQAKNVVMAYPDDIYEQRLNYTVSIYRFITDNTRRNILWWSKATGCFPKSAPVGSIFNINQGEVTISAAKNFSIPFTANCIEYNDPGIIYDFRELMKRYNPNIESWPTLSEDMTGATHIDEERHSAKSSDQSGYVDSYRARPDVYKNFVGLPYIIGAEEDGAIGGIRLVWKEDPRLIPKTNEMDQRKNDIAETAAKLQALQQKNISEAANQLYRRV